MKRISTIFILTTAFVGGMYLGQRDICKPVCDIDRWQEKVVLEKVYVDFNNDGRFDRDELRKNYPVKRSELAIITFKDFGSRYLWIFSPGEKKAKYQIKGNGVGLGKFTRQYIPSELLDCCYLEKGASRNKGKKQKPGNRPQEQKTMIRLDEIQQSELHTTGELEIVTKGPGTFVIQKDRGREEYQRIKQYKTCACSN